MGASFIHKHVTQSKKQNFIDLMLPFHFVLGSFSCFMFEIPPKPGDFCFVGLEADLYELIYNFSPNYVIYIYLLTLVLSVLSYCLQMKLKARSFVTVSNSVKQESVPCLEQFSVCNLG